ncbi:MAG: hypothetical protein RBR69_08675 [Candidatus Cloacimonadaceae bacterium]|nr:hypothetical protein [Candidatus Cloacimonadaceae bacterium]
MKMNIPMSPSGTAFQIVPREDEHPNESQRDGISDSSSVKTNIPMSPSEGTSISAISPKRL